MWTKRATCICCWLKTTQNNHTNLLPGWSWWGSRLSSSTLTDSSRNSCGWSWGWPCDWWWFHRSPFFLPNISPVIPCRQMVLILVPRVWQSLRRSFTQASLTNARAKRTSLSTPFSSQWSLMSSFRSFWDSFRRCLLRCLVHSFGISLGVLWFYFNNWPLYSWFWAWLLRPLVDISKETIQANSDSVVPSTQHNNISGTLATI